MTFDAISRRSFLKQVGAAGALAYSTHAEALNLTAPQSATGSDSVSAADATQAATRTQRMAWWHAAKFGMFIHWGLYSVLGQHEWAMEAEGIPIPQYEVDGETFQPQAQRRARLGKAGEARRAEVHGDDDQAS